jgi:hypothetical protein
MEEPRRIAQPTLTMAAVTGQADGVVVAAVLRERLKQESRNC